MEIEDWANPQLRRFVLLKHLMPALAKRPTHWDLMIDFGEKLLTFELRELPSCLRTGQTQVIEVTRLADHRTAFLHYEGPLTADILGADRGRVERVAAGRSQFVAGDISAMLRIQLTADELAAEFEVRPCAVGEQTHLTVFTWQWLA